jgi:hypothetical protein
MFSQADLDGVPEPLRSAVAAVLARRDADPSASLSRFDCMALFGHRLSKQLEIEHELVSFMDRGRRRFEKNIVYDRLIRLLIESNPAGVPPPKIREVPTAFSKKPKKPRPRTPQELAGLARGNAKRRTEAEERRARTAKEAQTTAEI